MPNSAIDTASGEPLAKLILNALLSYVNKESNNITDIEFNWWVYMPDDLDKKRKSLYLECTTSSLIELLKQVEHNPDYLAYSNETTATFTNEITYALKLIQSKEWCAYKLVDNNKRKGQRCYLFLDFESNKDKGWQEKINNKSEIAAISENLSILEDNNFWDIITIHQKNFIGREYVFNAIDKFIKENNKGFFIIEGEPGSGKTSILANYLNRIKEYDYLYYFSELSNNSLRNILHYLSNDIVNKYSKEANLLKKNNNKNQINKDFTSEEADFIYLLKQASNILIKNRKKLVVILDFLSESETNTIKSILDLLYLLPNNIYIVNAQRYISNLEDSYIPLKIFRLNNEYDVAPKEWQTDISNYLEICLEEDRIIEDWPQKNKTLKENFIKVLLQKSEGNFRYVKNMLDDIKKNAYVDATMEDFPQGLIRYYQNYLKLMGITQGSSNSLEHKIKIKLLLILVNAKQVSLIQIYQRFEFEEIGFVEEILEQWQPFLDRLKEEDGEIYYRLYHSSFREFIYKRMLIPTFTERLFEK